MSVLHQKKYYTTCRLCQRNYPPVVGDANPSAGQQPRHGESEPKKFQTRKLRQKEKRLE